MIIEFETHEIPFVRRLPIGVRKRGEYGDCRPLIHLQMPDD